MSEWIIQNSQLKARLDIYEESNNTPQSYNWIQALVDAIETLNKQSPDTHDIRSEFSKLPETTDRIRWELSHIPKEHYFIEFYEETGTAYLKTTGISITENVHPYPERKHSIGSKLCPYNIFWNSEYRNVKPNMRLWCFYEPTLAQEIGYEIIHTWDQNDSIVDWVTQFVQQPRLYSAKIATVGDDIHCIIGVDRTATQNILDFITQNPPFVTTAQILQQNFAGRRVTYKILRRLQNNEKVVRIEQGHYALHNLP